MHIWILEAYFELENIPSTNLLAWLFILVRFSEIQVHFIESCILWHLILELAVDFLLLLGVSWHPRWLGVAAVLSSWMEIISSLTKWFVRGCLAFLVGDHNWLLEWIAHAWRIPILWVKIYGTRWGFGFGLPISSWSIKWMYRHNRD